MNSQAYVPDEDPLRPSYEKYVPAEIEIGNPNGPYNTYCETHWPFKNTEVLHHWFLSLNNDLEMVATAQRVNDQKEKDKRWKEGWKDFYPNGKDGYLRWLLAIGCSKCLGLIYN